jgi:hypothetical protein
MEKTTQRVWSSEESIKHARVRMARSYGFFAQCFLFPFIMHWNATATQQLRLVPFQARSILPVAEEQSRTRNAPSCSESQSQRLMEKEKVIPFKCVFITAVPIIKLFALGGGG